MDIIDRSGQSGKSLSNRQRMIRRARNALRKSVHESSGKGKIRDAATGGIVTVPTDVLKEPRFRHASEGDGDFVLPGNREYTVGDQIPVPPKGCGKGTKGSEDGEGEDSFQFVLSPEEYLDLYFEDLELPNMVRKELTESPEEELHRAGYRRTGSPANMALSRTQREALQRRIALRRPTARRIRELEEELQQCEDEARRAEIEEVLEGLRRKKRGIAYIDPMDVRYRNYERRPQPVTNAVMFCLMDVSVSMSEHKKDLAKRFYTLLYLFLSRHYERVEVVFIRHTQHAQEVDEETFFHGRETGGTVVSSALIEMERIVDERYDPARWNIYAAQASDGDNTPSDQSVVTECMRSRILPVIQYFAYLEVKEENRFENEFSNLWETYQQLVEEGYTIEIRQVQHRREIYPVFRGLFEKGVEEHVT